MSKINLIQLIVVINSPNESFEVTKWYDVSKDNPQQMKNELQAIAKKLYSKIVKQDRQKTPDEEMIAVGTVSGSNPSKIKDVTRKVHYAWYKGYCLDPKRLSYFMPEKTLTEGYMTVEEIRNL
ncbi:hypothetical protein HYW99_01375 [Candidatus Woesearchaeota archaeon]|nr:hypothetical protein [Candidatus Aenigmarchaeota archaeon]MBI2647102.1 hypothetical protein [Candidatus Woesearchaeota archaeon]